MSHVIIHRQKYTIKSVRFCKFQRFQISKSQRFQETYEISSLLQTPRLLMSYKYTHLIVEKNPYKFSKLSGDYASIVNSRLVMRLGMRFLCRLGRRSARSAAPGFTWSRMSVLAASTSPRCSGARSRPAACRSRSYGLVILSCDFDGC